MAAYNVREMPSVEQDRQELCEDLSDFVTGCVFPQAVSVTAGTYFSKELQISSGDVLLLKSCNTGHVTLSYKDEGSQQWKQVRVSLEYPQKFNVLLPKESQNDNRTVSMVTYPTIADLLLDCPTYFEATTSYDDPYDPGRSVKAGDRFWFVEVIKNLQDKIERLKVRDERNNFISLSADCTGNFCPLKDSNEYTIRQLVELASVQRRLKIVDIAHITDTQETYNKTGKAVIEKQSPNMAVLKSHNPQKNKYVQLSNVEHAGVSPGFLPYSFTGVVHLLKYEKTVDVSPFNDLDTTWTIPVSANLKVRKYSQNDYEVPAPRDRLLQRHVPLPLPYDNELPNFQAPQTPSLQQPLVPVNIYNFVDIYSSMFPVKAHILSTEEAHPFFQEGVKNMEEVVVYRLDEDMRLYVKDTKSDAVYSLSRDLKLSFIEYPETFKTVSELLGLAIGSEITVLEDIAADFPKPFSLKFGDVIKLTSNIPYFVKMKHANRECQVLKCELVDSNGGDNSKLKLPLDLDISMVRTTESSSRRMISLQDILAGTAPIPSQNVASVPEGPSISVLKELPVELRILRSMKEPCIVVAPVNLKGMSTSVSFSNVNELSSSKSVFLKDKVATKKLPDSGTLSANIGLPLSSGIELAFRDRLDLFELDVNALEADYLRLPVEKISVTTFEERERLRKLHSDYEDIEFGSNSTLNECEACGNSISRTTSARMVEKKQKSTRIDKVLRLSRALNPKHWRHSKTEPEPLPHPSAMGLMALAARAKEEVGNEYYSARMNSTVVTRESFKDGSTSNFGSTSNDVSAAKNEEVEENFYEDVEIGPLKSSTIGTAPSYQAGAFSGHAHRSLPHGISFNAFTAYSKTEDTSDNVVQGVTAASDKTCIPATKVSGSFEVHAYDVPKPLLKAKNLVANIGNNLGKKLSTKLQYDIPKNTKIKNNSREVENVQSANPDQDKKPSTNLKLLSPTSSSYLELPDVKEGIARPPVAPARRRGPKLSSRVGEMTEFQINKENNKDPPQQSILISNSFDNSMISSSDVINLPRPKPRGQKKTENSKQVPSSLKSLQSTSIEQPPRSIDPATSTEQPPRSTDPATNTERPPRSTDPIKNVEIASVNIQSSSAKTKVLPSLATNENTKPTPPPKPKFVTHTTV